MGMILKNLDVLQFFRHKVNCVCVLFSTMCFLFRLVTLSWRCFIIFKLFVEFVANHLIVILCVLVVIFLCALIKVSLCDVWGWRLYHVHICNKLTFLILSLLASFLFFKEFYLLLTGQFEFFICRMHASLSFWKFEFFHFATHKFELKKIYYKLVVNFVYYKSIVKSMYFVYCRLV
jgi:hypothetical protein